MFRQNERQHDCRDSENETEREIPRFDIPETTVANDEALETFGAVFAADEALFTVTAFVLVHNKINRRGRRIFAVRSKPRTLEPGSAAAFRAET